MSTLITIAGGYRAWFCPRSPSAGELIEWNLQTRVPIGDCKAYDFMVSLPGEPPHHPRPGNIIFMSIKPRPRVRSTDNTPHRTPTRTPPTRLITPLHTPPGSSTPGNVFPQRTARVPLARTTTVEAPSPLDSGTSRSGPSSSEARNERTTRRAGGIPSPAQTRARASKAPQRCWNAYTQCPITGRAELIDDDKKKTC